MLGTALVSASQIDPAPIVLPLAQALTFLNPFLADVLEPLAHAPSATLCAKLGCDALRTQQGCLEGVLEGWPHRFWILPVLWLSLPLGLGWV